MKNKFYSYLCFFLTFMIITLIKCAARESFAWAGFNGFGDPAMEYTRKGIFMVYFILYFYFPFLIYPTAAIILIIKLYKKKESPKIYFQHILTGVLGIFIGIIFFQLDTYTFGIIWKYVIKNMIRIIRISDWIQYPIP